MKLLFLTLLDFISIEEHNIYTDLLREFRKHNHEVYVISPFERRTKKHTQIIYEDATTILKLRIGNIQKTGVVEKGITTVLLERILISGIKKYFSQIKFDLILYSTPPITFGKAIEFLKKRDNAKTYLLLKDIFPQNAIDLGMLSKNGWKKLIYNYFRLKEKKLYAISDYIGCMSKANCCYLMEHNTEIDCKKVEVCPNCIDVQDLFIEENEKSEMRIKYGIPLDKTVFVYGGNLGKPQGIPFLVECLKTQLENRQVFFLIVGDGTEFHVLSSFFQQYKPNNMKLMERIPKDDYDKMITSCDVGMIFLDHRFTIPNFPSRLLSYMQAKLPILAVTDFNTDVKEVIEKGKFGWWCESNNSQNFAKLCETIPLEDISEKGNRGYQILQNEFSVTKCYQIIIRKLA